MKTLNFVLIILSLTVISHTASGQCTYCTGGTVSGIKYASGLGTNPTATGNSSLAGGHTSTASGDYSIAFGYQSKATGSNANAFGAMVESNHTNSTVIGRHLKTMASETFIFGTGYGPTQYLINSTPSSLMVGFNSQYPTFFVSSSGGAALTGKVAIGNKTSPSSKLHLYADVDEAAEIKLEPRTTGIRQYAQILFDTHSIRAGNTENMVFTTPVGRNFAFANGNVGINTTSPSQKLDIDGNIRLRNNATIGTWSNNSLTFNTNSAARMTVGADGNIGINTTAPTQKLDIDGNIRLRTNATIGTWSYNSLSFNTNSLARMVILADGKVGVGTTPTTMFHVAGEVTTNSNLLVKGEIKGTADNNEKLIIAGSSNTDAAKIEVWKGGSDNFRSLKFIVAGNTGDFQFYTAGNSLKMKIDQNGNVGIGVTTSLQYKLHVAGAAKFDSQVLIDAGGLYVNGEVKAKKYLATISPFPDFVFLPGYELLTLNEVESFINENGHLPGVPDSADVEKNGIELGEMNALLLQKIEELTLYIIAQDKKIQALETVVNTQE